MDPKLIAILGALGLAGDYGQTKYIANHPHSYHEINPILGQHPSEGKVNTYFGLAGLGDIAANTFLPDKPKKIFNTALSAIELVNMLRNRSLGIGFNF